MMIIMIIVPYPCCYLARKLLPKRLFTLHVFFTILLNWLSKALPRQKNSTKLDSADVFFVKLSAGLLLKT